MDRSSLGSNDIYERGDLYAKRMLVRQNNERNSLGYSKSLRRRLSIMEAIAKTTIPCPVNLLNESNPFEKEFGPRNDENDSTEVNNKSKMSNYEKEELSIMADVSFSSEPSAPPIDSFDDDKLITDEDHNSNSIEYRLSDQFRRESLIISTTSKLSPNKNNRMSIGEYFGGFSDGPLGERSFHEEPRIREIERSDNTKAIRRASDMFFGARVLEVLEPEVVELERQTRNAPSTPSKRPASVVGIGPHQQQQQESESSSDNESNCSESESMLGSEDMREIDRDIDRLEQQQQQHLRNLMVGSDAAETPKRRVHQNLVQSGVRKSLEIVVDRKRNEEQQQVSPKKLFSVKRQEADGAPATVTGELNLTSVTMNSTECHKRDSATSANLDNATTCNNSPDNFSTPMPMTAAQLNNLKQRQKVFNNSNVDTSTRMNESTVSQLRRNVSYYLNNLRAMRENHRNNTSSKSGPNLESTRITNCSPISPPQQHQANALLRTSTNKTIPSEVENFLDLALGDEQYTSSSVTYMRSGNKSSQITASDLISDESVPSKHGANIKIPLAESSRQAANRTLNRTLTMYKTLTKRIKKKFLNKQADAYNVSQDTDVDLDSDVYSPNLRERVEKLLAKVDIEQTLTYQAGKALELCNRSREFVTSSERVECERALVLAQLRKRAFLDEIGRLTGRVRRAGSASGLYCERADLQISDFSLPLRDDALRRGYDPPGSCEHFLIVIQEGTRLWASQPVSCNYSSAIGRLYVPGKLTLEDLAPDFRILVRIYSLQMQQQIVMNHEDKYRIKAKDGSCRVSNKEANGRRKACPSPKKLIKSWKPLVLGTSADSSSSSSYQTSGIGDICFAGLRKSAFSVCGSVELGLQDLQLKSPWPLAEVPAKSILKGTIDLSLSCSLQLDVSHAGFLTHGDEAGGHAVWNRRWCVLRNDRLLFWNYPRDESSRPPLHQIELTNCVSHEIGLAERRLCPRPRTLLIETVRSRSAIDRDSIIVECRSTCTVVRNFLSCDTQQDLTEWQSKLNHVVSALREWNITDVAQRF
ncbi:hypothetical protein QAD02_005481 [Eretmocerus hayati]|uniref:Uncharacterized protein n=1 Tax=Eretmocerus hayati TaxID=131215 RepID=A0ACC2NSZ3_9HYME|nr:hypothetical protein QAD02_005481 [Eretmocerus hayati]